MTIDKIVNEIRKRSMCGWELSSEAAQIFYPVYIGGIHGLDAFPWKGRGSSQVIEFGRLL